MNGYFCGDEVSVGRIGCGVAVAGRGGNIPAAAAYNAIPASGGMGLRALVAATVCVAHQSPASGRVYPQLPREPRHTAARKGRIGIRLA